MNSLIKRPNVDGKKRAWEKAKEKSDAAWKASQTAYEEYAAASREYEDLRDAADDHWKKTVKVLSRKHDDLANAYTKAEHAASEARSEYTRELEAELGSRQ